MLLPDPLGPSTARFSPTERASDTPRSTSSDSARVGYCLVICSTVRFGIGVGGTSAVGGELTCGRRRHKTEFYPLSPASYTRRKAIPCSEHRLFADRGRAAGEVFADENGRQHGCRFAGEQRIEGRGCVFRRAYRLGDRIATTLFGTKRCRKSARMACVSASAGSPRITISGVGPRYKSKRQEHLRGGGRKAVHEAGCGAERGSGRFEIIGCGRSACPIAASAVAASELPLGVALSCHSFCRPSGAG